LPNLNGLINYWPIDQDTFDLVGSADLQAASSNASLASDRFGQVNRAIYCNSGYYQIPAGVYFSGDFTIIAWAQIIQVNKDSRLIDCGNGRFLDNIIVVLTNANTTKTSAKNYYYISNSPAALGNLSLALNQWYHVTNVLYNKTLSLYINGNLVGATSVPSQPRNVIRKSCFIGHSNWYPVDKDANAYFDDIKIYNRALSLSEIQADMRRV
jgi:hypothetical protein